jgi:hypothetical protein
MPSVSGNVSLSRLERIYMKLQSDFDSYPSFGNNDWVRHIKATLANDGAVLVRKDKTGHRTTTEGQRGRGFARWTFNSSLVTSGSGGTAPPHAPLFTGAFCQAGTSGGGAVTYSLSDVSATPPPQLPTFAMASYRTPSTLNQRIAVGCTPNELTWKIGEDIAEFDASGEAKFVMESDYFSSATAEELDTLGSFPAEPGAPNATDGGIIPGFVGSIMIGGSAIARIRTATIKMNNQAEVVKDTFGYYHPVDNEAGERIITVSFTMYDSDEASQQALREASITKTPVDGNFIVGVNAGNIVEFDLKHIQLANYSLDDSSRRFSLTMPDSRAYGTSINALDELTVIYR